MIDEDKKQKTLVSCFKNMKLTSEQTLTETLKNFQTYLKSLSIPVDLITRKKEVKKLELEGDFETGKVKSKKTLEKGIDNTSKIWYTNCLENKSRQNIFAMFTEPYVDEEIGEKIITVSQGIRIDDVQIGAVALDIGFSTLEQYVQEIKLLNTGYVILVDAEGNILVDNENNTYISDSVANNEFWNSFIADSTQETEEGELVNTTMEDVSDYAQKLNEIATELKDTISRFKL